MNPVARTKDVLVEELGGECVIYDAQNKKAHNLNPTATWVFRRCDGSTSISEIALRFEQEFSCTNGLELVESAIERLDEANLLVSAQIYSRRSLVTAASALAPVIASMVAPTAFAAKSWKEPKQPK